MIFGIGNGSKNSFFGGNASSGSIPNYTPAALPETNIGIYSFTANWSPGSNNVGYFLDVATDIDFTFKVSGFNNLNVGAVLTYNVTGLAGLHTYYYRVKAALNTVIIPAYTRTAQNTVNVIWDGSGDEIDNAYTAITTNSSTNIFRLVLEAGKTFTLNNPLTWDKDYVDIDLNGSIVTYGTTGLLHDTFVVSADTRIFNGSISHTGANYAIHVTAGGGKTFIMSNLTLYSENKYGFGCDVNSADKVYFADTTSSSGAGGFGGGLAHNEPTGTVSAQFYLINCTMPNIPAGQYGFTWTDQGSTSGTDFAYISGGNIGSMLQSNGGAGAGEAKIYISPTTVWNGDTSAWINPTSLLNTAAWQSFIGSNGLSLSGYSNVVSVTTDSEGALDFDNITPGTIYGAWDTKYKLLTAYSGFGVTLRESTGNTEQDFGFTSGVIDQAAVATFEGSGNVFDKNLYDQSGNGRDLSNSTNSTQPQYVLNALASGVPALKSDPSVSSLRFSSLLNVGSNLDIIAVLNITTTMGLLGSYDSGNYNAGIWQDFGSNLLQYYANANTFNVGVYAVPRNQNVLVRIRVRGVSGTGTGVINYYINEVLIPYTPTLFGNQDLTVLELFGFALGGPAFYLDGYATRIGIFTNAVDADITAAAQRTKTNYNIT